MSHDGGYIAGLYAGGRNARAAGRIAVQATVASGQRAVQATVANSQAIIDELGQKTNQAYADLRDAYARIEMVQGELLKARAAVAAERARADETQLKLVVRTAHATGLTAQKNVLHELGSASPTAFENSGSFFADMKTPKTKLRIFYERAFDAFLIEKGISNPERYREN